MKKVLVVTVLIFFVFLFTMSASMAAEKKYSGFLGDYSKNLEPGPKDGVKERWMKPGVDFSKYKKLMIDGVIFYFADDSEDKGIDGNEMNALTEAFNQELVNALKDKYPIVSEPGPDVMRVRFAITNIKKSKPGLSAITTVIPIGLGISAIKKGTGGSWSGSGATCMEAMGIDTLTGDVILVAADERTAAFTERFSGLGAAKEAFKFWAGRIRINMDILESKK